MVNPAAAAAVVAMNCRRVGVEFQQLYIVTVDHQTGVQTAAEFGILLFKSAQSRFDGLFFNELGVLIGNPVHWSKCAHAAGIGAFVVVKDLFMVLRWREHHA